MIEGLSTESLLLMYLADELSLEQRMRVEDMLARDVSLRTQLDELRNADSIFVAAMQRSDANQTLAVSAPVAVRKVARAMQQWQVDRFKRPAIEQPEEARLPFPWWCYPLATAAAAVFALIVWIGNPPEAPQTIASGTRPVDGLTEMVTRAEESWAISAEAVDRGPQLDLKPGEAEFNTVFSDEL